MTGAEAIDEAERSLQTILKGVVFGTRVQDPASRPGGEDDTSAAFSAAGALLPPYDPEARCLLVEHSNSLLSAAREAITKRGDRVRVVSFTPTGLVAYVEGKP